MNQEEGLTKDPDGAGTLTSDFQPPELGEMKACGLNRPVLGHLLQQPELTKAARK